MSDINVFEDSLKNFLSPIANLLEDPEVTEIMINGFQDIWVEKNGKVEKVSETFTDEDALLAAVNNIAQSVGRCIDRENPSLDARLPNGYRIHALIPPCARNGTTVAIRKFFSTNMSLKDYVANQALSIQAAQFLDICMKLGKNILISGGTGSGKTTLLGALCNRIPRGQRVIVIEDSSELKIDYDHVVFFETRPPNKEGKFSVTVQDLLKSSLRLRPDRIIVGEVRGVEAFQMIQAMNTGHKGCLGTVHANTCADALVRVEALAQGGSSNLSERALQYQVASAVDIVVQISRLSDGSRRVVEISEVQGLDKQSYQIVALYQMPYMVLSSQNQKPDELLPLTGEKPSFIKEVESLGINLFHSHEAAVKKAS